MGPLIGPVVIEYNPPLHPHTHASVVDGGKTYFGVVWKIYSVGQAVKSMKTKAQKNLPSSTFSEDLTS